MMTLPAQHITISINRSAEDVYSFSANPENLPKWASGLSKSEIKKSGNDWIADSPMGKVKVKFAFKNEFGVLDHDVTLPNGVVVHNPLRVMKNKDGSEVVFTLFRQPGVSDQDLKKDADHIAKDLKQLKAILEK